MNDERFRVMVGAILAAAVCVSHAAADERVALKASRVTLGCVDALLLLPGGEVVRGADLLFSCATSEYEDQDLLVYRPADRTCLTFESAAESDLDPDAYVVDDDTGAQGRLGAVLEAIYAADSAPVVAVDAEAGALTVLDADPACGGGGVANAPPTAVNDLATTDEGEPVTVLVLANDSDPEGATLAVTAVGAAASGATTFSATSVTYTPAPGFAGTDTFSYTIRDGAGATDTAMVTVTVTGSDRTPPALTAPPDRVAEANGDPWSTLDLGVATAIDLVDGAVAVVSDAPAAGFPLGTTVVTYTAADGAGNVARATQAVTVVDTTPPTLQLPPDPDVVATGVLTPLVLGSPIAQDLFGPVAIANDAPAAFPVGETRVTWTATDRNGNSSTGTQLVRVRYGLVAFLPPLSPGQVYKAGRVIPVKVAVSFGDGRHVTDLAPTIAVVRLASGEPAGEPLDVQAVGAASGGHVLVDAGEHYQFNLDTTGIGAGWIRISVHLGAAGPPHGIDVALK